MKLNYVNIVEVKKKKLLDQLEKLGTSIEIKDCIERNTLLKEIILLDSIIREFKNYEDLYEKEDIILLMERGV